MLLTRVRTLPGQTAAHTLWTALLSLAMVEGRGRGRGRGWGGGRGWSVCVCVCGGGGGGVGGGGDGGSSSTSRIQTDMWSKHAQLRSCLDSKLASPWPQHPVGPKRLPCHVLYGAGHCLWCTQSYVQTSPSPIATFDSSGSGCTDADSWFHPPRPVHSSPHGGLHPISWLTGHNFHHFRLEAGINQPLPLRRTLTWPSLWYREPWDSSLKIQCLHCLRSHTPCLLTHSRRRRLCSKVSLGHLAGRRNQYMVARSCLWMSGCLPNWRIICICIRGAEMKRFGLTIWMSWWSSCGVDIFTKSPRFLWCGRPVSRLHRKILVMHPWDTPSTLATSCWELPSADNLTICCSICCGKYCAMIPFKSSKKYQ